MDDRYRNREIDDKLANLLEKVESGFKGVHDRQDKTNGNIKDNACEIAKLKSWRSYLAGAFAVLSLIVIPTLFILLRNIL